MGIRKCSPINKKVVLFKQSSKRSNRRETKLFLKGLEKINLGSEYPGLDGYVTPFQRKPFQSKIPFQLVTSREQQKLMDKEVKEMLRNGAIRQANKVKGEILSNFFFAKKEDGGKGQ